MLTRRRLLIVLGTGGGVVAAAAAGFALLPGEETATGFPVIRYGKESCMFCGMTIGEERFAAAWRPKAGRDEHFDDIGCMVNASRHKDPGPETKFFVHDYNDGSWVDAGAASYVISPSIKTPMAYGLAALAGKDAAESLSAQQKGRLLTWAGVVENLEKKG